MKEISIPVGPNQIRVLSDPFKKHDSLHALVEIHELPDCLPLGINPRNQNTKSRVARDIERTLLENPQKFHLFNRGLTLTVSEYRYDNKNQLLHLKLDDKRQGTVDGGHTYAMILKNRDTVSDAYVKVEVLNNVRKDGLLIDLVQARNTSCQVKDQSLANLEGKFDWIKAALADHAFVTRIAWRENEDGEEKPLDVREVIAFLTAFHPDYQDSERPPVMAYTSKGRCLEKFQDETEENQKGYKNLRAILPDILRLYDYIHLKFPDMYEEIGGLSGLGEGERRSSVKLGKVVEVKNIKEGFPLYYLGGEAHYHFSDGWLIPVLASLRALVIYKGVYKWRTNPFAFFDRYGRKLVETTLMASREFGRNPNAVGKNASHWSALHEKNINAVLRLSGGVEDATFEIK